MTPTKGAIRQTALLDAAEEVLTTKGNANAAMRDFAAAAGIRIGHLQHYFPTRADLIRAVMARALTRSLVRLTEMTGNDVETDTGQPFPRSESEKMVRVLLTEHNDPSAIRLYVEVWAIASTDEQVAAVVRDFYGSYVGHVERLVARAQPELDKSGRVAVAETVVGLMEGSAILRSGIAERRSDAADDSIVRTMQHLIHGS